MNRTVLVLSGAALLAISGCGAEPNYTGLVDDYLGEICENIGGRYSGSGCRVASQNLSRESMIRLVMAAAPDSPCPDGSSRRVPTDKCVAIAAGLAK